MSTTNSQFVHQVYITYLQRPAEPAGHAFWVNELEQGVITREELAAEFGGSEEFTGRFTEANRAELINEVYQALFGRDAEAEGMAFWLNDDTDIALLPTAIAGGSADWDGATAQNRLMFAEKLLENMTPEQYASVSQAQLREMLSKVTETTEVTDEFVAGVVAALEAEQPGEPEEPGEPEVPGVSGETFELTADRDAMNGTDGNDTFNAYIFDNQNTLQNGDSINGGAGVDTLYAEVGNSQNFAIAPRLNSVENVVISARVTSEGTDSSDNNLDLGRDVQIDAGLARGVTNWESNDSRADLIIEDVRINPNQVTKDVTITFRDSDPGNVDYAVYFDQQSLISEAPVTDNRLVLTMSNQLDIVDGFDPASPLENIPYTHFNFVLNGELQTVALDLADAQTYADLEAALEEAFAAYPQVTIERNENAQNFFSYNGTPRTADLFVLTVEGGTIAAANPGWNADGGLPSDNSFSARVFEGPAETTDPLITSTIVLDNVGRGSTGGDLVIGGLSAGHTSTSKGVEQFDITVEQSSKLQFLGSTADSLQVVNLVNDGNLHPDVIAGKVVNQVGNLTLQGNVSTAGFGFDTAVAKPVLPSDLNDQAIIGADGQGSGYGLVNVREFNAATFVGDISLTAVLNEDVTDKYLDLQDQAADPAAADNVLFHYNLGSGNDNLALAIDASNLAAAGTTTREDFELLIESGAGDDVIEVAIYDAAVPGAAVDNLAVATVGNWYGNSVLNSNLAIDAGTGNDTVITYGSGDWNINLGAGNDVVYASVDTADNAVWVFNASNTDSTNLASNPNTPFGSLYGSLLTVEFMGFEATVELGLNTNNVLGVNQAIKQAIQQDEVLSKLLEVKDGPSNTLVVESLIEGDMALVDINVGIAAPTLGYGFTPADVSAYNAAYPGSSLATVAALEGVINASIAAFGADSGSEFQADSNFVGSDVAHTADNIINAGTGIDVIVLGTGANSNDTVVLEGAFGINNILHFEAGTGAGADILDFSSYRVDGVSGLGLDVGVIAGNDIEYIVAVENASNAGEYTFTKYTTDDLGVVVASATQVLGVIDFGDTLTGFDSSVNLIA